MTNFKNELRHTTTREHMDVTFSERDPFGKYRFRLIAPDVSIPNALRRTILSRIPVLVAKPDDCVILKNTSRFTNEILKQRIACIPIHTLDFAARTVSLKVQNKTDAIMYVTTKDITGGDGLFPPTKVEVKGTTYEEYIEIVRLKNAATDAMAGEEIDLTCKLSVGTARESGCYNAASVCHFEWTQDAAAAEEAWRAKGEISREAKLNWDLIDAKRFTIPGSFEFSLKTVGVYTNDALLVTACDILSEQLKTLEVEEVEAASTMVNCTDYILKGIDYTIGNLLEWQLYDLREAHSITYVSFFKKHPHDLDGILRVTSPNKGLWKDAASKLAELFQTLKAFFEK
jgi:DNA-directed RNA polymerase subunit L